MKTIVMDIKDVVIIQPDVYEDDRGFFIETFNVQRYNEFGVTEDFVQDNLSFSFRGVLRGLHYQVKKPQAKLIQVFKGEVYDVAVDLRAGLQRE